jgi:hypothetical protein
VSDRGSEFIKPTSRTSWCQLRVIFGQRPIEYENKYMIDMILRDYSNSDDDDERNNQSQSPSIVPSTSTSSCDKSFADLFAFCAVTLDAAFTPGRVLDASPGSASVPPSLDGLVGPGVLLCFLAAIEALSVSGFASEGSRFGGGFARITGTGPEKSFPVILESVCISKDGLRFSDTGMTGLRLTVWNPIFQTMINPL